MPEINDPAILSQFNGGSQSAPARGPVFGPAPKPPEPVTPVQAQSMENDAARLDIARRGEQRQQEQADREAKVRAEGFDATEGERKAAAFLIRALGANKTYEGTGVGARSYFGQMAKDAAPGVTNYFTPDNRQAAESAQDEFIAASLRQDSGAAIPEEELARQRAIYFPQPGDGPQALEQKRQARLRAIAGLEQSSGRLRDQTMAAFGMAGGTQADKVAQVQAAYDSGATKEELESLISGLGIEFDQSKVDLEGMVRYRDTVGPGGRFVHRSPPEGAPPRGGDAPAPDNGNDPLASSMFGEAGRFVNAVGGTIGRAAMFGLDDEFAGIGGAIGAAIRGEDTSAAYNRAVANNAAEAQAERDYVGPVGTVALGLAAGGAGGKAVGGIQAGMGAARRIAATGAPVTRQAIQSSLTGRAAGAGAAIGGVAGAAQGDTLQERGTNALIGTIAGGALGGGGQALGNRLANRAAPAAGAAVQQSADNLGIGVIPAVTGGTTTRMVTSGAKQGFISARPIDKAVDRMTGQALAARENIADNVGTRLDVEDAGNVIRKAGEVFSERTSKIGGKLYDRVERFGGGQQFPLTNGVAKADQWLADVGKSVQGKNGTIYKEVAKLREQMAAGQFDVMSIPRTRDEFRAQLQERGLRGSTLDTAIGQILREAEQDILSGLQASGNTRAVGAFKTATEFWQKRVDTIDNFFSPILGKNAPKSGEQVVTALERLANPKTGNAAQLAGIIKAMPPREAASVRATIINRMGNATPGSANNADNPAFSFDTFLTNWNNMSPRAKAAMFPPESRSALNDLANVAEAVKSAGASANRSNTAGAIGVQAAISGGGLWFLDPFTAIAATGGQYAVGRLLASPKFARLLARAPRQNTPQARQSFAARLGNLAQAEPALAREIGLYQRSLAANDNTAGALAAEQQNPQENQ